MKNMDIKQIKRSMCIDYLRLTASGEGSAWILALLPLAFTLIAFVVDNEAVMAGAAGAVIAMCAVYAAFFVMMVFNNEETTGNIMMNGIVPASRFNQVSARFALGLATDVITAVEGVLCLFVLFHHDEPSVSSFIGLGLGVFGVALFLGSVVIPIFYKFSVTKAMGWSFAILGLLFFAIIFLIEKFISSDMCTSMLQWMMTAKLGVVPWAALIAVLVSVVACVCSFLISVHIYQRKEL
ncbi:ABC-2 transporter permease [Bifidobacterium sp. ESL0682]|uniref:ABC-2 transporter permease n=1 Tax=Bifidobacterium sp. ESL0682 TaxID=2983212 RepID=UPI0023F76580|nr:ABC-2 transporter permease [Bifidobacterium sp. ESL0682]WEV41390.1 ABC-2 transporter permease [Bifidobacterium sp. ESL0682]